MESLGTKSIGYTVIALSLISIGIGAKVSIDNNNEADRSSETAKCLSAYVAENARVAKIRAAATMKRDAAKDKQDAAEEKLLTGFAESFLAPPPVDPQEAANAFEEANKTYKKLFASYVKTNKEAQKEIAAVTKERAANPLPEFPTNCSEIKPADEE